MLLLVNDGVVLYFVVVFNVCEGVDWVFNFFWVLVLVLIWVDGSEECFFYLVIDCVKLGVIVVNQWVVCFVNEFSFYYYFVSVMQDVVENVFCFLFCDVQVMKCYGFGLVCLVLVNNDVLVVVGYLYKVDILVVLV